MNLRIIIALLLLSVSFPLSAQETPEQIAGAQKHFESGANLFFEKNYEGAIAEFRAAHAVVPNPIFLYNIALAYVKLGNTRDALFNAKEARRSGLSGKDAVQNNARIAALSGLLRSEIVAIETKNRPNPAVSNNSSETDWSWQPATLFGWIGLGSVGVGALSLITTIVLEATLGPKIDAYKVAGATGDETEYTQLKSDIEMRQTISQITLFAGGGLVVVGAALYLTDKLGVWDGIAIVPSKNGIAIGGRF